MTSVLAERPATRNDAGSHVKEQKTSLIINADDWGRDRNVTERTLECILLGAVSSASAMVFMEDSKRAAELAREHRVDTGLHLNLTTSFTAAADCPPRLKTEHEKVVSYLRVSRLRSAIYHPGLARPFEYVVKAQLDEYEHLYGKPAERIDGHHHMHLAANVQMQKLLPKGTVVRRNFSFGKNEKSALNRLYRRWQDSRLAGRHRMTEYFFSLPPMDIPGRLDKILALAKHSLVELETHPVNRDEYEFLTSAEWMQKTKSVGIARGYVVA